MQEHMYKVSGLTPTHQPCPEVARELDIPKALGELSRNVANLNEAFSEINTRLSPLLCNESPKEKALTPTRDSSCGVGRAIRIESEQIEQLVWRARSLLSTLEV